MIKKNKKFLFIFLIFLFEISIIAYQKIAITPTHRSPSLPSKYYRETNKNSFIINYDDATETIGSLKQKIIKEFKDKEVYINPDKMRLYTATKNKTDIPTLPKLNFFDDENQAIIDIPKSHWIDEPPTIPSLFLYYD